MTPEHSALADEIQKLAQELPTSLLESLARALAALQAPDAFAVRAAADSAVPQPHYRALASRLIEAWLRRAASMSPQGVAFGLVTAARCEERARQKQSLELVWTGPEVEAIPPRRTDQALLQVINSATSRLTIVSFVAYKVPAISAAMADAARRGVAVRLVLEDPDVSHGKVAFAALSAFGPDVTKRATVYVWPLDKRHKDANGNHGVLHAKCAVADASRLLISSANLTEHALSINLELGLLLTGGSLPVQVQSYFDSLIHTRVLIPVAS